MSEWVRVSLMDPPRPLHGVGCGGHECNAPATHILVVEGEIEGSAEPMFYPTCLGCAERMLEMATHKTGDHA